MWHSYKTTTANTAKEDSNKMSQQTKAAKKLGNHKLSLEQFGYPTVLQPPLWRLRTGNRPKSFTKDMLSCLWWLSLLLTLSILSHPYCRACKEFFLCIFYFYLHIHVFKNSCGVLPFGQSGLRSFLVSHAMSFKRIRRRLINFFV